MKKILSISLATILLLATIRLQAQQDGAPDNTFGTNGIKSIYVSGSSSGDNLYSVLMQPDGKILFGGFANYAGSAGSGDLYIGRFNADGTFDVNFGSGGFVTMNNGNYSDVRDLALMSDGSILYGGNKTTTSVGATMGKLTRDGINSVAPVGPHFVSTTTNNNTSCMSYNPTNNSLVLGGYVYSTTSFMLAHKFNTNGNLQTGFGGDGTVYFGDAPIQNATYGKAIALLDDGSVLMAGTVPGTYAFSIIKLKPDGTLDNTFGNANPPTGISQISIGGSTSVSADAMLVLPNGKIMVCGTSNSDFAICRLNADGTQDNSFNATPFGYIGGSTDAFTSMIVQPDKKIIASGTANYGAPTGIIVRFNEDGSKDTTFGNYGMIAVPSVELNASAISVSDKKAIFAGKSYSTNQMTLVKIKYEIQKYNILGKEIVSVESENNFVIHPVEPGYTYNWSYSSTNVYTLGTNTNDTLTLYFNKTTPSGTIVCHVYDPAANLVKVAKKDITVNQEPTLAELLEDPQCELAQTYSKNNYINSFSFRQTKLKSSNTGSSLTGYTDLTASSNYDTLYMGDNYQATLECVFSVSGSVYCGIWIDFNNDGKMTDREFVGSSASNTSTFNVNNIVIPAEAEKGPKRVRVRLRQAAPFSSEESCMINEELSETEDYLIVLSSYEAIQAPNFITPNNDGKNDNFIVRGVREGVDNTLKVFNRVGDLVYDKENYDNSWGGSDKSGGKLKPGTYYFVFTQPNPEKPKDDVVKGFFEIRY